MHKCPGFTPSNTKNNMHLNYSNNIYGKKNILGKVVAFILREEAVREKQVLSTT
jgi:hypothetical protein